MGEVEDPEKSKSHGEDVPGHLPFTPHPNFTHSDFRSPGGGGHFTEAWLRNVKGVEERKSGKGGRKGRPSTVLCLNSTRVGWQHPEPKE